MNSAVYDKTNKSQFENVILYNLNCVWMGMWYREEIDLFFTTGISFFSMLAYVGIGIENIFMEIIFWILPQYIVIVYPEYLYTTMLIFSVIIIARYRKIIKKDWKERLMYACQEFNIDLYDKKDSKNFRKHLYANETGKNNSGIVCKDSQSTDDNVCAASNPAQPLLDVIENITAQLISNNDTITSKNNTTDTENFDGNTDTNNIKNDVKSPENVQSDIVSSECYMRDANLATGISGNAYPILVSYRAYLNLMVMICIFACDFPSFPQKHMKTDFFGLSLMDVGIGAYLFNNGCLHSYKTAKTLYTASLLFLLGCVRLLTLYLTNYKINITEYGKHLNFYFTLSFTYLLSLFRFTPKIGLLVMVIYEIALQNGLDIFIFTEKRNTLFLQNKEGIFQLIPSLCIFMFTRKISNLKKLPRQSARFLGLVRTTMVFILYYVISSYSYAPSRRLGNLSYVSWILALHSLHLTLTFVANYFVNYKPMKLHKYCSDNFMFSFLFANVIILICNLSGVQRFNRHLVMAGYLLSVFVMPYYATKYLNKR